MNSNDATAPAALPRHLSAFSKATGLVIDSVSATEVIAHADLGSDHHTPWGVIHGGVYTSLIESVGSVGASYAVLERKQYAVGVHNATDFLRPSKKALVSIKGTALFQGRTQQLWEVVITDQATGKELARGQLRTQNIPMPN